jgi:sec-independent protein translocase protein TatC
LSGRLRLPTRPRDEARMTLIEHLEELRSRIFRVLVAFVVAAIVAGFFVEYIFYWLLRPSGLTELAFLGPAQGLLTDIKLVLFSAFLLTLPVLIYQAWMFVAPAVGEVGRISTYILVSLSSALFLGGVAFGYFLVLPTGLHFLLGYAPDRYQEVITADTYLPFVTRFLLAFGVIFELPAATLVGARLGLVTAPMLKRYWRHALVVGAILAAALTPGQDPFSMIFMALPLYLMYGLSIVIARYVNPVVPHEEALEASPLSDRFSEEDDDDGDEEHAGERDL